MEHFADCVLSECLLSCAAGEGAHNMSVVAALLGVDPERRRGRGLGEKSSVCTKVIERLYAASGQLNSDGQYAYYGRVGGCLITGNEDGAKHCSMNILYSLQHIGYVIPPQADAGWLGEAGPGPSYLDAGSGGPENDFTNRNTTFMTWNLLHLARMIKDVGGIPAHGNQRSEWDAGCRPDFPNPEHR